MDEEYGKIPRILQVCIYILGLMLTYVMQCMESYGVHWAKQRSRCPNLLRNATTTNAVSVDWEGKFQDTADSIADLWSSWTREYFDADFPRLIIRFEDQLFHGEKVMKLISECSGLPMKEPFTYMFNKSKVHGNPESFISAMSKYSSLKGRQTTMVPDDLNYAKTALDPELMRIFRYKHKVDQARMSQPYREKAMEACRQGYREMCGVGN